jgi:hypothetical protein
MQELGYNALLHFLKVLLSNRLDSEMAWQKMDEKEKGFINMQ